MKRCLTLAVGIAVVCLGAPGAATAQRGKSEIEGTWTLVRFERDGKVTKPQAETRWNLITSPQPVR